MTNPNHPLYLHAFSLLPQFGPSKLAKISNGFATFKDAYESDANNLAAAGIEPEAINLFITHRAKLDLQNEAKRLEGLGINLVSFKDEAYPQLLMEIPQSP